MRQIIWIKQSNTLKFGNVEYSQISWQLRDTRGSSGDYFFYLTATCSLIKSGQFIEKIGCQKALVLQVMCIDLTWIRIHTITKN